MIGIIDSGLGGLLILFKLMKKYHNTNFTLIYDSNFFPYGEKSKEELIDRVNYIINKYQFEKTILACNTLSSINNWNESIYDIVTPTIKKILPYKRIGVIASRLTIKSNRYQNELSKLKKVCYMYDGQELINAIEKNDNIENALDKLFFDDIDCLILGCTHFIYVKDYFKKFNFNIISQDELI